MNVKLVVEKAEGLTCGHAVELLREETIVGRQRDSHLRIPSADVSRRHCILRLEEDGFSVEDLASLNGTYLNGQRVAGIQHVHPGDRLEIGPVTFAVHVTPESAGACLKPDTVKVGGAAITVEESATVNVKPHATAAHDPELFEADLELAGLSQQPVKIGDVAS